MKSWMRRHGMALAVGLGVLSLSTSGRAASEPPGMTPAEADEQAAADEELANDPGTPLPGKPLTADELGSLARMLNLHASMLTALEAHRKDAAAATKTLVALATRESKVLKVDGQILSRIKHRIVDENDLQAALSIPEPMLEQIGTSCTRWVNLEADVDRMLADTSFFDAMARFSVDIL